MYVPPKTEQLDSLGLRHLRRVYYQLEPAELVEQAIHRGEGEIAQGGALRVLTGKHTERVPEGRFIVDEPLTHDVVYWGEVNQPIAPDRFGWIFQHIQRYLRSAEVFMRDGYAGADPNHQIKLRVITETAWHNLFAHNMFRRPHAATEIETFTPDYTILHLPGFKADPQRDGIDTEAFVLINFSKRLVLIGGSNYAGEIKKAVFSIMNFLLPQAGVLPMHCSANTDEDGNTAIFFGLSGVGKTTLSVNSHRILIGDDEHGWGPRGVFNFEGGCYAKALDLDSKNVPEIHDTTQRFGTILENVALDERLAPDFADDRHTGNTRLSYPIEFIAGSSEDGKGTAPRNVIFLACDAFGVLPPVSKLSPRQAAYYFVNGYTTEITETANGEKAPEAKFSACFGAPFMPLHPDTYAQMLTGRVMAQNTNVWLINTGWTGGAYGTGHRIDLKHTRAIVDAILDGTLAQTATEQEEFFGLHIPVECPGVPQTLLNPRETWEDRAAYDETARQLRQCIEANYARYVQIDAEASSIPGAAD